VLDSNLRTRLRLREQRINISRDPVVLAGLNKIMETDDKGE